MSIRQFVSKNNIIMLWEVINDEEMFKYHTRDIQEKIYQIFLNNIQGFFDSEKTKTNSLVDMNKKYILLVLNHIKTNYPYQPSKITIHNETPVKEKITYEEIQNERKTQFEKDYNRRQEDFEELITIKTPPIPDFSDKQTDKPIKEMDKILKDMQTQRNYEVEQINKIHNNTSQVDNWLKPQETSLKNDKFQQNNLNVNVSEETQPLRNNKFKFLNELEQDTSITNKKNVSWNKNNEVFNISENIIKINEYEEDDNIFSKLKKVSESKKSENVKLDIKEITQDENITTHDKILELERNVKSLNEKIDKLINLLNNK
jgi:hypothetical protein